MDPDRRSKIISTKNCKQKSFNPKTQILNVKNKERLSKISLSLNGQSSFNMKNREKKIENSYTVKKSVNLKKMFMGPGSRSELNGS